MSQESKTLKNVGELQVSGVQVVGAQALAVADGAAATVQTLTDSTGGTPATSVEAGSATVLASEFENNCSTFLTEINSLRVDVADIRTQLNDLLAKIRTHGLIAT